MAHDVFICHSSKDKKIADAICAKLEQNKIRCWIAPRDVVPGSDFAEAIVQAIHATKVTVFVFSANSNVSPHVKHELERTVSLGLPVLPFRVDDVLPSPALEYFISSAHWLDALTPPLEQHIDRLVTTVAALLEREVPTPVSTASGATHGGVRRRRWIVAGVAAAAVLAAVAGGLVVALGGGGSDRGAPSSGPTATSSTGTTPGTKVTPFKDDFTTGLGAGWTWTNEDATAWRTTPQGWLEIDSQESPPMHNLLLRDAPGSAYEIKVHLRFPSTAGGFAGLLLMGDDPGTWLEYGLTRKGLSENEYANGSIVTGAETDSRYLELPADRDIRLILAVDGRSYRIKYYDRKSDQYLDWTPPNSLLNATYSRIGLAAYRNTGAAGTASFDSFEVY
ncbi:MAG TPA: toll/interleukin-1 receptor domain-containing protein [Marmoricola sp.]|nr:toll/interleukin-1 receptor domain-containing protein [Marmoricola sp.]